MPGPLMVASLADTSSIRLRRTSLSPVYAHTLRTKLQGSLLAVSEQVRFISRRARKNVIFQNLST